MNQSSNSYFLFVLVFDFGQKFLLSSLQFVIIVNITVLTFAFCVGKSLASVLAFSREIASSILVVAVVAHAHSIDR